MKITSQSDYAIRCILYMAKKPEKIYTVSELSKIRRVPKSFLAKILQKLSKAGIVISVRGIKGGFKLKRKPEEINLFDVIIAIEKNIALNQCLIDKDFCELIDGCFLHLIWREFNEDLINKLKNMNFALLAKEGEN